MKLHLLCFWLFNGSILIYLLDSQLALAQIVPDTTLPVNSIAIPKGNTTIIEGGTAAGTNLFHSFERFSVPTGGEAFFNNASNIQNIFSRVTGRSISNIDGLIRANGTANLFLINPNGIIFGPNAQLNIGGSFLASTASSIRFADGVEFSATNPNTAPLLTINVPIGLQFASQQSLTANLQNPGAIVVQGSNLEVQTGKTLALVGGNITIEGSNNPLFRGLVAGGIPIAIVNEIPVPTTPGGRIELGSITEGNVTLAPTDKGFILGYSGIQNFGDIQFKNRATVNTSGIGGGEIQIQARNLQLNSGSRIVSFTLGPISGGDIIVNASESVELLGTGGFVEIIQRISRPESSSSDFGNGLFTISFGAGNAGNIVINTSRFSAQNGSFIVTSSTAIGQSGSLSVNASNSVQVNSSGLITSSRLGSIGAAGNIDINTRSLLFDNLGLAISGTPGQGAGGNLVVNASESAEFIGGKEFRILDAPVNTGLITSTLGAADAGNIRVTTKRLVLRNRGSIAASTFGEGQGGTIDIDASESVELQAQGFISTSTVGAGKGGNLTINTRTLLAQSGAQIGAAALSAGDGGNLTINANQVQLIGTSADGQFPSGLGTEAAKDATGVASTGAAGNLTINTGILIVQDGAGVSAATLGAGKGGNLTINANQVQLVGTSADGKKGSSLFASAEPNSKGDGGNLTIETGRLTIKDRATVSVSSTGAGKAGTLQVSTNSIELSNQASLDANTTSGGGSIQLVAPTITLRNSSITTNATGGDRGGDISVTSQFLQLRDGSTITTNATGNEITGGNITLNINILAALKNSDITANSEQSQGGKISINADAIFGALPRTREDLQFLLNTKDPNSLNPRLLPTSDITAISQQGGP
ncbi:filamentous hemagglutinin N-terminal domain-containing protein, partial [Aerosakkonemataceae cyanobacterium BLCC-F50]